MNMKKFSILASVVALSTLLVSCGPTAYLTQVQTRQPSSTGLDLGGKSMSVVFVYDQTDSLFNNALADAFASGLEADYFSGKQAIDVYSLPQESGAVYSSRDTLASLVMELDSDIIFLFDSPELVEGEQRMSAASRLYFYDSLGKSDDSTHVAVNSMYISSLEDVDSAKVLGAAMAKKFAGTWKDESFWIIAYDAWENAWVAALYDVVDMDWPNAIDKWLSLLNTESPERRACAEYNLAVGCLVSGEYQLAKEWLDRSDADKQVNMSPMLRKQINERLK